MKLDCEDYLVEIAYMLVTGRLPLLPASFSFYPCYLSSGATLTPFAMDHASLEAALGQMSNNTVCEIMEGLETALVFLRNLINFPSETK